MDLKLQGKRALVTGSSKGIGEAIARVLAREGATVIVPTPTFFINSQRHDGDFERRRLAKRLARQLATTNDPAGDTQDFNDLQFFNGLGVLGYRPSAGVTLRHD